VYAGSDEWSFMMMVERWKGGRWTAFETPKRLDGSTIADEDQTLKSNDVIHPSPSSFVRTVQYCTVLYCSTWYVYRYVLLCSLDLRPKY
jgi:hypothetical protein